MASAAADKLRERIRCSRDRIKKARQAKRVADLELDAAGAEQERLQAELSELLIREDRAYRAKRRRRRRSDG